MTRLVVEDTLPRAIDSGRNTPVDCRLSASRGVRPQVSFERLGNVHS
jgi:hypothetical protein